MLGGAHEQTKVIVQLLARETETRLVFTSPLMKPAEVSVTDPARTVAFHKVTRRLVIFRAALARRCRLAVPLPPRPLRPCAFPLFTFPSAQFYFTICYFKHSRHWSWSTRPGAGWAAPGARSRYAATCRVNNADDCTQDEVGLTAFRNYRHAALSYKRRQVLSRRSALSALKKSRERKKERKKKKREPLRCLGEFRSGELVNCGRLCASLSKSH